MEEFERVCCICGYHVHQEAWEAAVGEEMDCEREPNSAHDGYTVAVKRRGVVMITCHESYRDYVCSSLGLKYIRINMADYLTP